MKTFIILLGLLVGAFLFSPNLMPRINKVLAQDFSIGQLERQRSLVNNLLSQGISSQTVKQVTKALHLRHIRVNIRRLPKIQNTAVKETAGQVQVLAGDRGVTLSKVKMATQILDEISLPVLSENIGEGPNENVELVLFSNRQTYGESLLKAGVSSDSIQAMENDTGGLTIGSSIWIPLYNLEDKSDLANVLTHELTHVVFNQEGIGDNMPTWINEGTAWYDGLAAQAKVNPNETQAVINYYRDSVLSAAKKQELLPLTSNEQEILKAPYNVEFEDYMALDSLIKNHGLSTFKDFLKGIASQGIHQSFTAEYGQSISSYENSFYHSLK